MTTLEVGIPRKLLPLRWNNPARYKGAHGGRGGAKSHFFAEQLVLRAYAKRTRAVCIREVQNSIKESVRQLIVDKINKFGMQDAFQIFESEIKCPHGGLIIFKGMQAYNAANIKSLEDYDIAWVEEAQTLSAVSWRMLRPTIRKTGSEIWCSWNPRHDTDPIDEFFRGPNKPEDAICIEVNHRDNPWFPSVLKDEMRRDFAADPEMAEHVWNGGYEIITEGSYYARLIADAEREGRVGDFPYDPQKPVHSSWDLGIDDYTSIWFWQDDGIEATVIDFYETSGDGLDAIVAASMPEYLTDRDEQLRRMTLLGRMKPYRYGRHYLPHDIRMREIGAGARSRVQSLELLGVTNINKGVPAKPDDRVQAVRALLPFVKFNATPRVLFGLKRMRNYCRRYNDSLGTYVGPLHDENSHAADAFGEYAVNNPLLPKEPIVKPDPVQELLKPRTMAELYGDPEDEFAYDD